MRSEPALTRRAFVGTIGMLAAAGPAFAAEDDPRLAERSLGDPDAPVTVIEFFSLTCTHCARFSREVMPQVRAELIATGKVRMVYRDFPLDQIALTAAMIARALPADRYEPFINALFASQDRWAFDRGANTTEQLWKIAALAGMNRETFDATVSDTALAEAIIAQQKSGETEYHVDSTPTFIIRGQRYPGELSFEKFQGLTAAAG
jgi:protein-disulfide isomerase